MIDFFAGTEQGGLSKGLLSHYSNMLKLFYQINSHFKAETHLYVIFNSKPVYIAPMVILFHMNILKHGSVYICLENTYELGINTFNLITRLRNKDLSIY